VGVYAVCYRVAMIVVWLPYALPVFAAALWDGWQRRRISKWRFEFSSPMRHRYASRGAGYLMLIAIAVPALPFPIPPLGVPAALGAPRTGGTILDREHSKADARKHMLASTKRHGRQRSEQICRIPILRCHISLTMDGMVGHAQIKALKRRSAGDKKNVLGGTISHREIGALIYMKKFQESLLSGWPLASP